MTWNIFVHYFEVTISKKNKNPMYTKIYISLHFDEHPQKMYGKIIDEFLTGFKVLVLNPMICLSHVEFLMWRLPE